MFNLLCDAVLKTVRLTMILQVIHSPHVSYLPRSVIVKGRAKPKHIDH